jgi:hypothetical protein
MVDLKLILGGETMYPPPLWLWIFGIPCLILCFVVEYRDRRSNPDRPTERKTRL